MLFSVARRCVPWRLLCAAGCWPPEGASSSSGVASSLGGEPPSLVMICRTGAPFRCKGAGCVALAAAFKVAIPAGGLPDSGWL